MSNFKVFKGNFGLFMFGLFAIAYYSLQVYAFIAWPIAGWSLLAGGYLLNIIVYIVYLSKETNRRDQNMKVSWGFVLFVLPMIGALLYRLGSNLRSRHKRKKQGLLDLEQSLYPQLAYTPTSENDVFASLAKSQNQPVFQNSEIVPIYGAPEFFNALIENLEKATKEINFEFFILNDGIIWNKVQKILIRKHQEGVKVRILTDYVGNAQVKNNAFKNIRKAGIPFHIFNPVHLPFTSGFSNFRNHTKIVIIDNYCAFFGGANIGDDYAHQYEKYGHWIDMHFIAKGEIIEQFNKQFISDWFKATKENLTEIIKDVKYEKAPSKQLIQMFYDGPHLTEAVFLDKLIEQIKNAKKTIRIISPYIILPWNLELALKEAVLRGVNIQLITAGRPDKKSAYNIGKYFVERLVGYGVEVYRAENIFCHAKMYIFDETTSIVGTTNLDYRALYHHFESNFIVESNEFLKQLDKVWLDVASISYREDDTFAQWGLIRKFKFLLIKLVAPMF